MLFAKKQMSADQISGSGIPAKFKLCPPTSEPQMYVTTCGQHHFFGKLPTVTEIKPENM